jgi:hypothetical protein
MVFKRPKIQLSSYNICLRFSEAKAVTLGHALTLC